MAQMWTTPPSFRGYGTTLSIGDAAILWGGDFNTVLSLDLDRVGTFRSHHPQAAAVLKGLIDDYNLVDSWRVLHPNTLEGTCITQQHLAWSRLDFWLTSQDLHSWVLEAAHYARTLSNHSPVTLTLQIPKPYIQPFTWRLLLCWIRLLGKRFTRRLQAAFEHNVGSVESAGVLWEAFKVVLRGHCIAGQNRVLRDIRSSLGRLDLELHALEAQYFTTPSTTTLGNIRSKLTEYQEEADREITFLHKYAIAHRYGEGDRPGKTLANLLRPPR